MLSKFIVKLATFLLRNKKIKEEHKTQLMSVLLDNIGALPMRSIVTFDDQGTMNVGGKRLELEQAIVFRDSARALQESFARKLINEQIAFLAVQMAVHQGLTPEMIVFSKAALWLQQEENLLIQKIINE